MAGLPNKEVPSLLAPDFYTPMPNTAAFRDLLIFEERLKQNAARMKERKNKYQTFLIVLCLFIVWLTYLFLFATPQNFFLYYLCIGFLLIGCMTLVLFFASGLYADKISASHKFIPQANRSLRTFNMYLNMRTVRSWPSWITWISFLRGSKATSSTSTDERPARGPYNTSGTRSTHTFQRRATMPKVPPTRNDRGEIIFSSRVDTEFREGYERYRNAFERKRREKLEAQRLASVTYRSRWPFSLFLSTSTTRNSAKSSTSSSHTKSS